VTILQADLFRVEVWPDFETSLRFALGFVPAISLTLWALRLKQSNNLIQSPDMIGQSRFPMDWGMWARCNAGQSRSQFPLSGLALIFSS
jgi:hypothetical protein